MRAIPRIVLLWAAAAASTVSAAEETVRVVPVEHLPATELVQAVSNLAGGEAAAVAEPLSNQLILRGTPEVLDHVEELLAQLDRPPKSIIVELTIATLQGGDTPLDWTKPGEELKQQVAELEQSKKLRNVERVKLMALDNQPTKLQRGGSQPQVQAVSPAVGGRGPARSFTYEHLGTLVQLTAASRSPDRITLEISIELSSSEPGTPLSDDPLSVPPPIRSVASLSTTVRVADGETVLLAGSQKEGRQMLVLLRAHAASP